MIISRQKCQPCFSPETVQRPKITNNLGIGIGTEVGADVVCVHWHLSQTPCVFVDVCVSSLILDRASQILKLDLKRRSLLVFLHLRLWISHSPLAAATVAGLSPLSLVHSFCEEVTTFTHHRMLKSSAVCYFKPRRLGLGWGGGGRGRQVERRCGSRINRPQILTCGECLPSRQVRLRHDLEQSMRWCHFFLEGDKVALAKLFIPLRLLLPFSSFMFLFHSKFCLVLLSGSSVIVGHTHVQFSAAVSIFFFFELTANPSAPQRY